VNYGSTGPIPGKDQLRQRVKKKRISWAWGAFVAAERGEGSGRLGNDKKDFLQADEDPQTKERDWLGKERFGHREPAKSSRSQRERPILKISVKLGVKFGS